jgi:hypothetical protein
MTRGVLFIGDLDGLFADIELEREKITKARGEADEETVHPPPPEPSKCSWLRGRSLAESRFVEWSRHGAPKVPTG